MGIMVSMEYKGYIWRFSLAKTRGSVRGVDYTTASRTLNTTLLEWSGGIV